MKEIKFSELCLRYSLLTCIKKEHLNVSFLVYSLKKPEEKNT